MVFEKKQKAVCVNFYNEQESDRVANNVASEIIVKLHPGIPLNAPLCVKCYMQSLQGIGPNDIPSTSQDTSLSVANLTPASQDEDKFSTVKFKRIAASIRDRIKETTNISEIIQCLTIFATEWTIEEMVEYFNVSRRHAVLAKKTANEKAVVSVPDTKTRGFKLGVSENVKECVTKFFLREDVSRCLPGQKDVVKGKQKHLLLFIKAEKL